MKIKFIKTTKIIVLMALLCIIAYFLYCVYGAGTLGKNLGV